MLHHVHGEIHVGVEHGEPGVCFKTSAGEQVERGNGGNRLVSVRRRSGWDGLEPDACTCWAAGELELLQY